MHQVLFLFGLGWPDKYGNFPCMPQAAWLQSTSMIMPGQAAWINPYRNRLYGYSSMSTMRSDIPEINCQLCSTTCTAPISATSGNNGYRKQALHRAQYEANEFWQVDELPYQQYTRAIANSLSVWARWPPFNGSIHILQCNSSFSVGLRISSLSQENGASFNLKVHQEHMCA